VVDLSRVQQQFESQAVACEQLGSPFTARLCRLLERRLTASSHFGRRILEWEGDPFTDNVALRACGAIHALARSGWEPNLTAYYPPNELNDNKLWDAIGDALKHNDVFLTERLSSPPQTNEVARSGWILGAMLHLSALTRTPLEIFEMGASAGLNLAFDEYRHELGEGRVWGDRNAPVTVECTWRGTTPPLDAPLSVVGRHGCDLRPIDPANADDRARLISYVWADQLHRMHRVEAALAHAARLHRTVDRADAADWLADKLAAPQLPGTTRVVLHTIVWDYLPATAKARLEAAFAAAGARATTQRPFARISVEPDDVRGSARIDLTVWPDGSTVTLGRGDFHGRWAEWA
jgi:hypothetical protein